MNEWIKYSLEDLAFYYNGKAFKPSDWKKDGVKIIRIEQLNNPEGFYDFYQGEFPDTNKIENGDLIFSWSATLKVLIWKHGDAVLNQHLFKVVPKQFMDKHFLFFLLDQNMEKIGDTSHGSTMKHIKRGELEKFFVFAPDKTIQQQIAKILYTADAVIEKTQAAIDKYKAIKQGMLHDLFTRGIDISTGKLRPKYEDAPELYKESKLGWVPKEWEVEEIKRLIDKNILDDIQDGNHGEIHPKSSDFVSVGIPFVMASDISNDRIDFANCHKISIEQYSSLRIGFSKAGDVLLSHKASIGFVAKVPIEVGEIMLTPQVTYYRVINESVLSSNYLEYFMRSNLFQIPLHNLAKQSTRDYIGITMQKSLNIAYPLDDKEQKLIEQKLISIYNKLESERSYLLKLQKIKSGLMSDLLSGKKRVIVKEAEMA